MIPGLVVALLVVTLAAGTAYVIARLTTNESASRTARELERVAAEVVGGVERRIEAVVHDVRDARKEARDWMREALEELRNLERFDRSHEEDGR